MAVNPTREEYRSLIESVYNYQRYISRGQSPPDYLLLEIDRLESELGLEKISEEVDFRQYGQAIRSNTIDDPALTDNNEKSDLKDTETIEDFSLEALKSAHIRGSLKIILWTVSICCLLLVSLLLLFNDAFFLALVAVLVTVITTVLMIFKPISRDTLLYLNLFLMSNKGKQILAFSSAFSTMCFLMALANASGYFHVPFKEDEIGIVVAPYILDDDKASVQTLVRQILYEEISREEALDNVKIKLYERALGWESEKSKRLGKRLNAEIVIDGWVKDAGSSKSVKSYLNITSERLRDETNLREYVDDLEDEDFSMKLARDAKNIAKNTYVYILTHKVVAAAYLEKYTRSSGKEDLEKAQEHLSKAKALAEEQLNESSQGSLAKSEVAARELPRSEVLVRLIEDDAADYLGMETVQIQGEVLVASLDNARAALRSIEINMFTLDVSRTEPMRVFEQAIHNETDTNFSEYRYQFHAEGVMPIRHGPGNLFFLEAIMDFSKPQVFSEEHIDFGDFSATINGVRIMCRSFLKSGSLATVDSRVQFLIGVEFSAYWRKRRP